MEGEADVGMRQGMCWDENLLKERGLVVWVKRINSGKSGQIKPCTQGLSEKNADIGTKVRINVG